MARRRGSPARFWIAALWLVLGCACSSAATPAAADAGAGASAHADAGVGEAGAPPPADESGFFDVPPRSDVRSAARLFYVFLKSDVSGAPLVVFSNGGPGFATSFGLLAYGTARATVTASGAVEPNPGSWTSFANLLYIDERQSGFSYGVGPASSYELCKFDPRADAADFVRGLLDFLDGHPALRASPVIIAAESYGGTRATYMLDLLLHYREEAPLVDKSLADRIQQHYDRVFPGHAGTTIEPQLAAQQFGAEVLVQPYLGGQAQQHAAAQLMPSDPWLQKYPQPQDAYDVRKPLGWSDSLDGIVATALVDPAASVKLLGVDLALVPRIGPADRADAFRTPSLSPPGAGIKALNASLTSRAGALASGDAYVHQPATACADAQSTLTSGGVLPIFADNLRYVRTFITDARYDTVVYAPTIPYLFAQAGYGGVVDDAPRPGVARPGWFEVSLPSSSSGPAKKVEVRFPQYDDSGHMVALSEGVHLHDDVVAWLGTKP